MSSITVYQIAYAAGDSGYEGDREPDDNDAANLSARQAGMQFVGNLLDDKFGTGGIDEVDAIVDTIAETIKYHENANDKKFQVQVEHDNKIRILKHDKGNLFILCTVGITGELVESNKYFSFNVKLDKEKGKNRRMEVSLPADIKANTLTYLRHVLSEIGADPANDELRWRLAARLFFSRCN